MKRFLPILMASAVASVVAFSQSDEMRIRRVLEEQIAGWNAGSVEKYMEGLLEFRQHAICERRGYANVLARYRKSYDTKEKMGTLSFEELRVRLLSPEAAVATGVWRLRRANDEPWVSEAIPEGIPLGHFVRRFTLLLQKKYKGWRIVYDHTSSAK
ncbi:MAG: hypothetical protein HY966_00790 [Ignavibacteriales bacterium]|nr:hypothetical protein [Ignavibacteriales bacterium]